VKLNIEPTARWVDERGVPLRMWEGHTEAGVPVTVWTAAVMVKDPERYDMSEFEELKHMAEVAMLAPWPPRTLS
jgi:hypothetical protein